MEFTGRLLAHAKNHDTAAQAAARLEPYARQSIAELDEFLITVPAGEDENSLGAKLLASGCFDWVRPDWRLFPAATQIVPDDPIFDQQWHLPQIQAPQAWNINTGLPTAVIAIVDSGVDLTHPDLHDNLVPGYASYFMSRQAQTSTTDPICQDTNGHGTAVAGAAAAMGNNAEGVCGVGWNLRVMPIRATNANGGTGASFADIQNGALWASTHGARIVNVSFTGVAEPGVEALGATLRSRGVMLIWVMDDNTLDYGATFDHPDVTVVSGTNQQDQRYPLSSYGQGVDIAAPAASIATTALGGFYGTWDGNSMAGPIVAGAAACVWGMAPWLTPAEVEKILFDSADDIGPPGEDPYFGVGRVNLRRAMWLTVVRQHCASREALQYNTDAFGIEDLYKFTNRPLDVSGDGVIDDKDTQCLEGFLRSDEPKDMTIGRP
jgi:subtilisin family serine protease